MVPRALNDTKKIRKAGADIFRVGTVKKIVSAWGGYVGSVYAEGGAVFLTASRHYLATIPW